MRLVSTLFLAFLVTFSAGCAMQPPRPEKASFVIQVSDNDPAKWNLALNNAKNVQHDLGKENTDIEIVAYGPGLNMLKLESSVGNNIQDAEKAGVKIIACGNTMKAQKVTKDDLLPGVAVVPAGVIEIGTKQQLGWSYIRP
jgi:intracellular sulfur oxidation DsrE/DsrF family protein